MESEITDDGCPVEAYAAMSPQPELDQILDLLGPARSVLDLGCGAGRIANPLARHGFQVTGVDTSAQMLAYLDGVTAVTSGIEDLNLEATFDAVLLLSNLINQAHPGPLVAAARRHLRSGGMFIAQRLPVRAIWEPNSWHSGPVSLHLDRINRAGDRVDATTTYTLNGRSWDQAWTLYERDDAQIEDILSTNGFTDIRIDGIWCTARAAQ